MNICWGKEASNVFVVTGFYPFNGFLIKILPEINVEYKELQILKSFVF
tara:strand:+ start:392 stop:535 length:144 start_codon:yes stop_codon:yes gene_type:complete